MILFIRRLNEDLKLVCRRVGFHVMLILLICFNLGGIGGVFILWISFTMLAGIFLSLSGY